MPPWLLLWIIRWASGERFRKATSGELRWFSAFFAFVPVWLLLFADMGHSYLDKAGVFGIWLYIMACIGLMALWLAVWIKFVPAIVSWVVGAIIWIVMLYLIFTGRIF
jgi:hypothetical protein